MKVIVTETAFDPWHETRSHQDQSATISGKFGATANFVGTARDFNDGNSVDKMVLEYYPGMTEKQLEKIVETAGQKWQFLDCLVVHRVGEIFPGDSIVLVSVWASHRGDAFDACRFIMEQLKSTAPFWKQEYTNSESRWVEHNSSGYDNQS